MIADSTGLSFFGNFGDAARMSTIGVISVIVISVLTSSKLFNIVGVFNFLKLTLLLFNQLIELACFRLIELTYL